MWCRSKEEKKGARPKGGRYKGNSNSENRPPRSARSGRYEGTTTIDRYGLDGLGGGAAGVAELPPTLGGAGGCFGSAADSASLRVAWNVLQPPVSLPDILLPCASTEPSTPSNGNPGGTGGFQFCGSSLNLRVDAS